MLPTDEILRMVALVDNGISRFLDHAKNVQISMYESIAESRVLLNICIRHFDAINELAKKDLVYLPSVLVLARTLFETAVNVLWILYPDDIFECESRYLTRLIGYEAWIKQQIDFYNLQKWNSGTYSELFEMTFQFRTALQKLLAEKGYQEQKYPNVREVLKSLNEERKYLYYKLLSTYTHSGYKATEIFRKNLGAMKQFGEFVDIEAWKFIYGVSWPIFEIASELFILRGANSTYYPLYDINFKKEIRCFLGFDETQSLE
jgi:hypothetical protein